MQKTLKIGNIVSTLHINFDPIRAIGRIRGITDEGYRVEYPDGEVGIILLSDPKFLDNKMYKEYIDVVEKELEGRTDLSINDVIRKVNHWIRKGKKMTEANKILSLLDEGMADQFDTPQKSSGQKQIWMRITTKLEDLEDMNGRDVPTQMGDFYVNILHATSSWTEIGMIKDGVISKTYLVSTKEMKKRGVFR